MAGRKIKTKLTLKYGPGRYMAVAMAALILAGCTAAPSRDAAGEDIDIFTYAPALDVQGRVYDTVRYYGDLDECRRRALRVGEIYASLHEAGGEEETGFSAVAVVDICMTERGYRLLGRE